MLDIPQFLVRTQRRMAPEPVHRQAPLVPSSWTTERVSARTGHTGPLDLRRQC
jgi:hypothetical protein